MKSWKMEATSLPTTRTSTCKATQLLRARILINILPDMFQIRVNLVGSNELLTQKTK